MPIWRCIRCWRVWSRPYVEPIQHGGALPDLTTKQINLYVSDLSKGQVVEDMVEFVRQAYQNL